MDEPCCSTQSDPPASKKTRKTNEIFGLGKGITEDDAFITGSRLPTCRQVLRSLIYHYQAGISQNITRTQDAKEVLGQINTFYLKGNIPMILEHKACEKMIKLLEKNSKLRAIPVARRSTKASLEKVKQQDVELDKTFDLWPPNVERLIKNSENPKLAR